MVVSRLPAGCRVDASASCLLNSASAVTSAYQRPAASCPLAHFFPFAYVCWLVITSPLVAPPPPCIAFCCTAAFASILDPPSSLVPAGCCVASCHIASASQSATGSRVASCGTFALHSPARPLLHRNFHCPLSRSLGATAIAGILKCTAHSPGGGIANGHCFLLYGSRPPTRPPARPLTCSLLRHLRLKLFQLALSRTAIVVTPSLGAAAITGVLKCTAHSPGGGIAIGHCSLLYGSRHPTRPPSPPHGHLYSSTIHHPCPTLVISWRKVMTWRLLMFK